MKLKKIYQLKKTKKTLVNELTCQTRDMGYEIKKSQTFDFMQFCPYQTSTSASNFNVFFQYDPWS